MYIAPGVERGIRGLRPNTAYNSDMTAAPVNVAVCGAGEHRKRVAKGLRLDR